MYLKEIGINCQKKKKEFYYLDTDWDVLVDFNSLYINNKCFNSLIAFLTTCISC